MRRTWAKKGMATKWWSSRVRKMKWQKFSLQSRNEMRNQDRRAAEIPLPGAGGEMRLADALHLLYVITRRSTR